MSFSDVVDSIIQKQHDIFLSYESEFEKKVIRLYNLLVDKYLLKVWLDLFDITQGENVFQKTTEAINNSKIVICCVTKLYPNSSKCKNDITLAYTSL